MSKTLYKKGSKPSKADDIWDDSLLIKAYEESIRLQKAEVAKRIANSTNKSKIVISPTTTTTTTEMESDNIVTEAAAAAAVPPGAALSPNDAMENYALGDYVRATYDDDGVDYEAQIISFEDNGYCLVKFLGYGNEQLIKNDELLPSWGLAARKKQMAEAADVLSGTDINYEEDETGSEASATNKKRSNRNKKKHNGTHLNAEFFNLNAATSHSNVPFLPPPPPMPPMLNDLTEDSEDLSAMLMAWYMSGYYTGFYQGRKLAQKSEASPPKKNKK